MKRSICLLLALLFLLPAIGVVGGDADGSRSAADAYWDEYMLEVAKGVDRIETILVEDDEVIFDVYLSQDYIWEEASNDYDLVVHVLKECKKMMKDLDEDAITKIGIRGYNREGNPAFSWTNVKPDVYKLYTNGFYVLDASIMWTDLEDIAAE